MSWVKADLFSRTSSRTSSASSDTSSKTAFDDFTLYGSSVPLRRTRTIIHRAKTRTFRTLSLIPGVGGGAAKLLAENATLDLGFPLQTDDIDSETNPYDQIEDSCSEKASPYLRRESDSSDIAESEKSECCTSVNSSIETSPEDAPVRVISRSSTAASWVSDEFSVKSNLGSSTKPVDDSSGEWNNFWEKYNKAQSLQTPNDEIKSNASSTRSKAPEKRSPQIQKVIMSTADAIEAASCARRLSEILSSAIRRSSVPCTKNDMSNCNNVLQKQENSIPEPPSLPAERVFRSKSDSELPVGNMISAAELRDQKLKLKSLPNDCVEVEIRSTDPLSIADLLKKVLEQRRSDIMPEDCSSGNQSHRSDWSSFD